MMTLKGPIKKVRPSPDYYWFLKKDVSSYSGQWIAFKDRKILIGSRDISVVLDHIKDMNREKITVTKIPEKDQTLVLLII